MCLVQFLIHFYVLNLGKESVSSPLLVKPEGSKALYLWLIDVSSCSQWTWTESVD